MPNLLGLSLREVYKRIYSKDLKVQIKGSGLVSRMSPEPGESIDQDEKIKITLELPK